LLGDLVKQFASFAAQQAVSAIFKLIVSANEDIEAGGPTYKTIRRIVTKSGG
jgi:hypothetical protein